MAFRAPTWRFQGRQPGTDQISRQGAQSGEFAVEPIVPDETVMARSTQVTKTLLSPAYGASAARFARQSSARLSLPAETATALLPGTVENSSEQRSADRTAHGQCRAAQTCKCTKLDYHGKSHAFFFALGNANQSWSFRPLSSDARLLYCLHRERKARAIGRNRRNPRRLARTSRCCSRRHLNFSSGANRMR